MAKKYFTVDEANGMLPLLRSEIIALQNIRSKFEEKYRELLQSRRDAAGSPTTAEDPFFQLECEIEFLQLEASAIINSFAIKGVELKDVKIGLVDFPALIGGREVLLCWKLGEDQIEYYHGVYDGFEGRRRLTGGESF